MVRRIVIDAYQDSSNITGTDRMAHSFLRELQKIDQVNSYTILCSSEDYQQSIIISPNFRVLRPSLHLKPGVARRLYEYIWRKYVFFTLWIKKPDVYYSFHNLRLPKIKVARKTVSTNLDLIPIKLDDYKGIGRISYKQQFKRFKDAIARSDRVVSISNYSKRELIKTFSVPENKVEVILLACDPLFNNRSEPRIILPEAYILTIGGSEPRKNVSDVIKAYELLPEDIQSKFKLLIAGGKWHGRELTYNNTLNITELGYVADSDLLELYASASLFVFASTYEGFGFTILESMASGTPVINARGSSLDEVAGNATLSFTSNNTVELSNLMQKVLTDKKLRNSLVKTGYEQNAKFSWEKSAKELHSILITI